MKEQPFLQVHRAADSAVCTHFFQLNMYKILELSKFTIVLLRAPVPGQDDSQARSTSRGSVSLNVGQPHAASSRKGPFLSGLRPEDRYDTCIPTFLSQVRGYSPTGQLDCGLTGDGAEPGVSPRPGPMTPLRLRLHKPSPASRHMLGTGVTLVFLGQEVISKVNGKLLSLGSGCPIIC